VKPDPNVHPLEQISAFSDGELTSEEAVQIQEHLRACPDCRQTLHDIRRMTTAGGEEAVPAPPAGLATAIRKRIEFESGSSATRKKVSFWKSPFPLATAAAVILAMVAYLGWRRDLPSRIQGGADLSVSTVTPSSASDTAPSKIEKNKEDAAGARQAGDSGAGGGFAAVPPQEESSPAIERDAENERREDRAANGLKPAETQDTLARNAPADEKAKTAPPPGTLVAAPGAAPLAKDAVGFSEDGRGKQVKKGANESTVAGAVEGAPEAKASESAEGAAAVEARSLAYEGPDFSATLAEDGLMTVITRGYACSVSIEALTSPPPAGRMAPKTIDDLPSLFAAAVSKEFLEAPSRPEDIVAAQGVARASLLSTLTLRDGKGDPLHSVAFPEPLQDSTPEIVRSLRQGMQRLFAVRYRPELEKRCGPLPPVLAPAR
jgi:anti-sigma factor RsiW